jgi:hypothetical protein
VFQEVAGGCIFLVVMQIQNEKEHAAMEVNLKKFVSAENLSVYVLKINE